ncbi:MAG: cupin domain-containing protein [Pseudomonadota bacterium]
MTHVISAQNAEHYVWGDRADGWHLLKSDDLSVIEERVPPGVGEVRHYHDLAQQFFYVLAGVAELEVAGQVHRINANSGLHVAAGVPHQLHNPGPQACRFLVISQPKSHGDRVLAPATS